MFRYIIALVLINVYNPCTGLPLKENAPHLSIPIAKQLQNLANICENSVISELIKTQIESCNVSETTDSKTEFKCLMFYDINSQLCSAFGRSKFNLKDSYTNKINEIQDIKILCDHAKAWSFTKKDIYPKQESIDQVFKNDVFCIQMCSVKEVLSTDSNFFCKYYQWGLNIIQNQTNLTQQNSGMDVSSFVSNINPVANNTEISNSEKNGNGTPISESVMKPIKPKLIALNIESTKPQLTSLDSSSQTSTVNQSSAVSSIQKLVAVVPDKLNVDTLPKNEIETPPFENISPNKDVVEKAFGEQKEPVIENPKEKQPVANLDEDQEDENDDDPDYNPVDADDAGSKLAESDPNLENQESKNSLNALLISDQDGHNVPLLESEPNAGARPHKSRIVIESAGPSISETFPNSMQDNFTEEDDHFFPFFLTAIIIVVLLYILYHNKNKFTKVILGLLVEGRQTGRRRNSRGHAYRRLDTLEQAMSTNTAAPPSKIIY